MSQNDDIVGGIGAGKNGDVYACPECYQHETVKWLAGDVYRYHCDDCDITYTKRDSEQKFDNR